MVKQLWQLALLLCVTWSGIALADARFTLKADKKTIALGEALTVELRAEDARAPLSGVSLDKLKQSFNVFGISSNIQTRTRKGRTVSSESMTLILYPLHSGKLLVPALRFMNKSSKALEISVTESGKNALPVMFKTAVDVPRMQVRQTATLTLDIYDDGTLQWTVPRELRAAGAHQRWLAESQREAMLDGIRYTVHRYAWALMPLREGGLTLEFPLLDAFKFGTRLRYPLAALKFDVAAVPAYLPVHLPIGKLQVTAEPLPDEIALDRPVNWKVTIQGSGLSEAGLAKLLTSIRSNESLRFYPAMIVKADSERATTAAQKLLVTLPFVPLQTGTLQLPAINLPYYDPASERVDSVVIAGARIKVFDPLWLTVQRIALGLLALLSVLVAGYWLSGKLRYLLRRRKALLAIKNSMNADELQHALLHFDIGTAAVRYATLQQWLQRMQLLYGDDERLAAVVRKLASVQYGADATDSGISGLAHDAAILLRKLPARKSGSRHGVHRSFFLTLFHPSARTPK
ncbi:MAG TPA: BatD family protein [Gallionellaceae bacterium]|nr:BatD family protein [Gallionellaceae bacterium]